MAAVAAVARSRLFVPSAHFTRIPYATYGASEWHMIVGKIQADISSGRTLGIYGMYLSPTIAGRISPDRNTRLEYSPGTLLMAQ